ncbi:unnamed protein product, partial [marine sediment metagenome]
AKKLEVMECLPAPNANLPIRVRFHYVDAAGAPAFQDFTNPPTSTGPEWTVGSGVWPNHNRDQWVNPDGTSNTSIVPFYWENLELNGVPVLTVKVNKLPAFLDALGAAPVSVNNSLAIWANTASSATVKQPAIGPSLSTDMGVVIRDADDLVNYGALTGFTTGFSVVTDHRVYIVGDVNQVAMAAPANSGMPAGVQFFPPVSIFAAEKRFG